MICLWQQITGHLSLQCVCEGLSKRERLKDRLSKEDHSHECSGHHPSLWGPQQSKKAAGGQTCSLCLSWDFHLLSPGTLAVLALGPSDSDCIAPPYSLVLQLWPQIMGCLGLIISWVNSYFVSISLSPSYWSCFSGEQLYMLNMYRKRKPNQLYYYHTNPATIFMCVLYL